jgi:hypothetical protein
VLLKSLKLSFCPDPANEDRRKGTVFGNTALLSLIDQFVAMLVLLVIVGASYPYVHEVLTKFPEFPLRPDLKCSESQTNSPIFLRLFVSIIQLLQADLSVGSSATNDHS